MDAGIKCKAAKADGTPCGAYAQGGGGYCFQHDPAQATAAADSRRNGGMARAAQLSGAVVPSLTTAEGVRDYLAARVGDVAAGLLDAHRAKAIAALYRIQLVAIEKAEREESGAWLRNLCPQI